MDRLKLCYVYLHHIPEQKAKFAGVVPRRMSELANGRILVHVVYMGAIDKESLRQSGVKCHRVGGWVAEIPVLRYIVLLWNINRVVRRENIDVLQNVWAHFLLLPLRVAALFTECKVVARVAGNTIPQKNTSRWWVSLKNHVGLLVEGLSLRCADHIHLVSRTLKQQFSRKGIPEQTMTVISQGCNTNYFRPVRRRERSVGTRRILYVGRASVRKGLDTLVSGFHKLRSITDECYSLCIVGCRQIEFENVYCPLQEITDSKDSRKYIHFKGYRDHGDLVDVYNDADLFVLPSRTEGLPNVLLEAMACELPCVATPVGDIPTLLADSRGCLVPVDSPSELSRAMHWLLNDRERASEMGKNARDYIVSEHSYQAIKGKYINLFNSL